MKDLKKFIATTIREYLNENISLQIDDIYIKYETSDKRAYADIEKTSNDTWYISFIESRRKGGGTELMNRIMSDAKIQGIKKITLTTTEQIGWGFFDGDFSNQPFITFSGMTRVSKKAALITENWLGPDNGNYYGVFSYGVRFFGETISVDLAFINNSDIAEEIIIGIPYVDFVVKF